MIATQWAKELGIESKSFRQRIQRWGTHNERTWEKGSEQGNEEYRKLSDKITPEKIARLLRIPQPGTWEIREWT